LILIDIFVEKFHNYSLPKPEKCFVLEEGDELYINKWIKNGKIVGMMLSTVQKDAVTGSRKDETSINYFPESTF